MERNPITLQDLNFYYPYIRKTIIEKLEFLDSDIDEELITSNIQLLLSEKMKSPKTLKTEIDILRKENIVE